MTTDAMEALQGVWNIVSLEIDGRTLPAPAIGGAKIVIQGDHFTSIGMGTPYEGTIALDPTAIPKTFDLNFVTGPETGNTNLGIYELDGDVWRICLATRGTTRPTKFVAEPGTGVAVEVLERDVKRG
jgi:uncharacterized protein (TIGR03067 family)